MCIHYNGKVGCVFEMVVVCLLPLAEFGRNDHQEDTTHFIIEWFYIKSPYYGVSLKIYRVRTLTVFKDMSFESDH